MHHPRRPGAREARRDRRRERRRRPLAARFRELAERHRAGARFALRLKVAKGSNTLAHGTACPFVPSPRHTGLRSREPKLENVSRLLQGEPRFTIERLISLSGVPPATVI